MSFQVNFGGQPPMQNYQQMGYMGPGYQAPPASNHYGSYGNNFQQNVFSLNAWQALSFNDEDEFRNMFLHHMSPVSQAIQAEELQRILDMERIKSYYKINWSLELCKIMIAMLDRSGDGRMQYEEFKELLQCLTYWYQVFCQYDVNRSGYIEAGELGKCISERYGYKLSPQTLTVLLKRYARSMDDGRLLIAFDDFVSLSVRLRTYTEAFRGRDRMQNGGRESGHTQFGYDDFLQTTMCL